MRNIAFLSLATLSVSLAGCPPSPGASGGSSVVIEPAAPTSSEDLVATLLDEAGLPVEIGSSAITWAVDGVGAGASSGQLLAAATTRGESWTVTISTSTGDLVSPAVTIGNSVAAISEVQLSPVEPGSDELIEVLAAGWSDVDGDPQLLVVDWMLDGEPIAGASGMTLQPGPYQRGDSISVVATPDDGFELGAPVTSSAVVVGNGAPFAPTVAITPAEPSIGLDDLVCTVDMSSPADPDDDVCTYDVRWILDGAPFPDPTQPGGPEPGTTILAGDTIPANETEVAQNWTCRVTAHDGTVDSSIGEASVYLAAGPMSDFALVDENATSPTTGLAVSPRDFLQKVSGWYFGHAT